MSATASFAHNSQCASMHQCGLQSAVHLPAIVSASHNSCSHSSTRCPVVVSGGQTQVYTYSKVPGDASAVALYPPSEEDKRVIRHTYASYSEEPVPKVITNSWAICVDIPIPTDITNPTLISLVYAIKYASTHDNGNSTVQADTILTQKSIAAGVTTGSNNLGVYHPQSGYGPRTVDRSLGLCLSSVHGIKGNGGCLQWSHYIDQQHVTPNVRILDVEKSNLYLVFHVHEYPTIHTTRSLAIDVSVTWKEGAPEIPSIAQAPGVADKAMQDHIAATLKKLGIPPCPQGLVYLKTDFGYQCSGGGHRVTFQQLGMK